MPDVLIEPLPVELSETRQDSSSTTWSIRTGSPIGRVAGAMASLPSVITPIGYSSTRHLLPVWTNAMLAEVRRFDELNVLSPDTLQRLLQAVSMLPPQMPKPEVGVGDDGTVGLEWSFGGVEFEIYVSNELEEDAFIFADNEGETVEAPLFQTLPRVFGVLRRMSSGR